MKNKNERNEVLATNFDFLIPIYIKPKVLDTGRRFALAEKIEIFGFAIFFLDTDGIFI